jgi:hypothetical protein
VKLRIGVTIMYHPSRRARVANLVASCAPLVPQVVCDPDPTGTPSPLRTAKLAWATIRSDATHHLVLQDDVVLADGFAKHLAHALAERPYHAVALYSNWNSPHNSYLVRRAAATGSPWARLSPAEWTPTEGLVLPVDQARRLARFLAAIPDEVSDDDEMAARFFREMGLPVFATVPHLVDHADERTLAGHPGSYHATVYAAGHSLSDKHWRVAPRTRARLPERAVHPSRRKFVVELTGSRCLLRILQPACGEPVEHPYGWYWNDWGALVGVDPERLLQSCAAFLFGDGSPEPGKEAASPLSLDLSALVEVWAAGYLLGADLGARGCHDSDAQWSEEMRSSLLRDAISSWIDSGLEGADRRLLDAAARSRLVDLGVASVACGRAGRPLAPSHTVSAGAPRQRDDSAGLRRIVQGMARREAAAHLLTPPYVPASSIMRQPAVALRFHECPECGPSDETGRLSGPLSTLLRNGHAVLAATGTKPNLPTVAMLGCEWLTTRSILPVIVLAELAGEGSCRVFRSRALAWAEHSTQPGAYDDLLERGIGRIDATESWADAVYVTRDGEALRRVVEAASERHGDLTLPASSRLHRPRTMTGAGPSGWSQPSRTNWAELRRALAPHFLTPHHSGVPLARLNLRYMQTRLRLIQASLCSGSGPATI